MAATSDSRADSEHLRHVVARRDIVQRRGVVAAQQSRQAIDAEPVHASPCSCHRGATQMEVALGLSVSVELKVKAVLARSSRNMN